MMEVTRAASLTLKARAKLNLALDIMGRRPDGRHNIETVMQSLDLADDVEVTVTPGVGRISVQVSSARRDLVSRVPEGEQNIAHRAAAKFLSELGAAIDVDVRISKTIPVEAGLGGGSADAGAVLVALNRLLCGALSPERLRAAGEQVGADVPFVIYSLEPGASGAAFATGVGATIEAVPAMEGAWFVIAVPAFGLSTRDMYELWDERPGGGGADARCARAVADAMKRGADAEQVCRLMGNDFHSLAEFRRPEIGRVACALMEQGAMRALLTGSGSAVFGVFRTEREAKAAACSEALRMASGEGKGAGEAQEPVSLVAQVAV